MKVTCNNCQTQQNPSENKKEITKVRCTNCNHIINMPSERNTIENEKLTAAIDSQIEYAEKKQDVMILRFPGDSFDASNSDLYKRDLLPLIQFHKKIIFDFAQIEFIDSSGCGVLVFCEKNAKEKGTQIVLCNVAEQISSVFRLTKLFLLFTIVESEEKAIQLFKS